MKKTGRAGAGKGGRKKRRNAPKKRTGEKKNNLRRIARFHFKATAVFLVAYLFFGLLVGPAAILLDWKKKYAQAADVAVSAWVAGPPGTPVVETESGCDSESPYVRLSWDATTDTDNYDIYRDSALLVTGITAVSYEDTNVSSGTAYSYEVVANGPLGSTSSEAADAEPGECASPAPDPALQIISINGRDLSALSGILKVTDRTPTFTGTTNIPFARIRLEVYSGPSLISSTVANGNGYWSWTVPDKLDYGLHTIYVTAIDPADAARYTTSRQNFRVGKKEAGSDDDDDVSAENIHGPLPTPETVEKRAPFGLKLEIENGGRKIYMGSDIATSLSVVKLRDFTAEKRPVKYEIVDARGNVVFETEEEMQFFKGAEYKKNIALPAYLSSGKYRLQVRMSKEGYLISAETAFEGFERPILRLGNELVVTYPQAISYAGHMVLAMLLLLAFFAALAAREYWLSRRARTFVDEKKLARGGYIS